MYLSLLSDIDESLLKPSTHLKIEICTRDGALFFCIYRCIKHRYIERCFHSDISIPGQIAMHCIPELNLDTYFNTQKILFKKNC